MQDEVEKLDMEIAERHAQEVADLRRRQPSAGNSNAPPANVMELADSLYDTKLSAGAEKVFSSRAFSRFSMLCHPPSATCTWSFNCFHALLLATAAWSQSSVGAL